MRLDKAIPLIALLRLANGVLIEDFRIRVLWVPYACGQYKSQHTPIAANGFAKRRRRRVKKTADIRQPSTRMNTLYRIIHTHSHIYKLILRLLLLLLMPATLATVHTQWHIQAGVLLLPAIHYLARFFFLSFFHSFVHSSFSLYSLILLFSFICRIWYMNEMTSTHTNICVVFFFSVCLSLIRYLPFLCISNGSFTYSKVFTYRIFVHFFFFH